MIEPQTDAAKEVFKAANLNTPFPKIHNLGTPPVDGILEGDDTLEVTEKLDGSQFGFGKQNGEFFMRSRNNNLSEIPSDMFSVIMKYVEEKLKPAIMSMRNDCVFYGEYLRGQKSNVLKYDRIPKNNLILFGYFELIGGKVIASEHSTLEEYADLFDVEAVPLLWRGRAGDLTPEKILDLVKTSNSVLGGDMVEGVVIKRYGDWYWRAADHTYPLRAAKFVQDIFKEKASKAPEHRKAKDCWAEFCESFRTEARWRKAVQRITEDGTITYTPKDIGALVKLVQEDVRSEDSELIQEMLWKFFGEPDCIKKSITGMPQWYKEQLALGTFTEGKNEADSAV